MYLLDTGVVLELRKAKAGRADPGLTAWAAGVPRQNLFLSVLTLLELGNVAARDKAAAASLQSWIDSQVLPAFEGRIVPVDAAVVRRRARLPYADGRDALLAATALEHDLYLVTRNVRDVQHSGVAVFNPWIDDPATCPIQRRLRTRTVAKRQI